MANLETNQGLKDVVVPEEPHGKRYYVRIVWELEPITLVPVNVRNEYVFI